MKNKITSLAWAIMIAVAIIITAIVISVAIRMFIPYGEYIVIGIGVLIGVSLVYRDLYPKEKYFLVSYFFNNGKGNKCLPLTRFVPCEIENEIGRLIGTKVVIISAIELTKKEFELNQKVYEESQLQVKNK